ncbi:hypothetical protein WEI85_43315 [Actinomycetes bacterium KLBMP 9797]
MQTVLRLPRPRRAGPRRATTLGLITAVITTVPIAAVPIATLPIAAAPASAGDAASAARAATAAANATANANANANARAGGGGGAGAVEASDAETLHVNLSATTGDVRGGATGILYGLGDPGVPSRDLIAGMRPHAVSQKAPDGEQHPNGDAVVVADELFAAGGEDVHIYAQDVYSRWPYQDLGIEDYLSRLRPQLEKVARRPDRGRFVWSIFNEPDWIWYADWATKKDTFLADWTTLYRTVKAAIPEARIAGPGETHYIENRLRDFLGYAKANDVLPDIVTWHELSPDSLTHYRGNFERYRVLERELGIGPLPVEINEYANRRDTSVPGQIIQWLTMFEDTKVDAQMAYWTLAGNLSDHAARASRANGGWWLTKWYADLSGQTVRVTPPRPSTRDTLQGLATVDKARNQATVLLGGTDAPVTVAVSGIDPRLFGRKVDVHVRRAAWSGYEGDAGAPPVLAASRSTVVNGTVDILVPGGDKLAAYQVVIEPAAGPAPRADAPWSARYEAEAGTVENATVYRHDENAWSYTASGGRDVGSMNRPDSRVTVDVAVPRDGIYTLGVVYGTNAFVGQQALYVDGIFRQTITFPATLGWSYRGRLDLPVTLTAGTHTLSLRTTGPDGFLGGISDITLDRVELTEVTGPERAQHPAGTARLTAGARLNPADGTANLPRGGGATFFLAAAEDGYYTVSTKLTAAARGTVALALSERAVPGAAIAVPGGGAWTATSTVFLRAGITRLTLTNRGPGRVAIGAVHQERHAAADRASARVEAETGTLAGGAAVASGRWAAGGSYVGGIGSGGTLTVPRPTAARHPGPYALTVGYAQADKNTGHPYNTDAITRFADVTEGSRHTDGSGRTVGRLHFRHNYTWDGFWPETYRLDLKTRGEALTFGNDRAWGPNIDWIQLSPLAVSNSIRRTG